MSCVLGGSPMGGRSQPFIRRGATGPSMVKDRQSGGHGARPPHRVRTGRAGPSRQSVERLHPAAATAPRARTRPRATHGGPSRCGRAPSRRRAARRAARTAPRPPRAAPSRCPARRRSGCTASRYRWQRQPSNPAITVPTSSPSSSARISASGSRAHQPLHPVPVVADARALRGHLPEGEHGVEVGRRRGPYPQIDHGPHPTTRTAACASRPGVSRRPRSGIDPCRAAPRHHSARRPPWSAPAPSGTRSRTAHAAPAAGRRSPYASRPRAAADPGPAPR